MESNEKALSDGEEAAEEERILSLMAMLHDMVRRKGRIEAARVLGLDPRTVGACMDSSEMSWRVREALERAIQGDGAAGGPQRIAALERRVEALEDEMRGRSGGVEGEGETLSEEVVRSVEGITEPPGAAAKPTHSILGRREYPELVTKDPAPDDEEVYGEAWKLIEEWRDLWKSHSNKGKGLKWLRTEQRIRELEVAMMERHGLTLPPEKTPLRGTWRRSQLNWRKVTLREVRRAVAWRHLLRKALTCGLWGSRWWPKRA